MKENEPIGKISFDMDSQVLETIMQKGRLEEFVTRATTIFRRDLMTQLVESDSSVSTTLMMEDDDFGTGPRPPHWFQYQRLDILNERINALENMLIGGKMTRRF